MIVLELFALIIGIVIALWFVCCTILWIYWFFLGGKKGDTSGDATIGILLVPIAPFVVAWEAVTSLFRKS